MKKTKEYKLSDKHYAIAKIQDDEVLIYIEEWKRVFFGLIQWPCRVGLPKAIKLHFETLNNNGIPIIRSKVRINRFYIGAYWEDRNAATFNLKSEIDILYASFLESLKSQENKQKQIDNFINSID